MSNSSAAEDSAMCNEDFETAFLVCGATFQVVTLLLSLTFNGLIFTSVLMDTSLRTLPYTFIVNLAVTDVLSSLILIPMDVMYLAHFPNNPFPGIVNNVWKTAFLSLLAASVLNFTAVSLDRYIRIRYPLQYMNYLTKGRVTRLIAVLWLYVLVLAAMLFFAFEKHPIDGVHNFKIQEVYLLPFLISNVFLPFCVIIVLYACIYRIIRHHMRCIDVQNSATLRHSSVIVPVRRQRSILRDLSSTKTVCLVVFCFSLTWFPFLVVQLYSIDRETFDCKLQKADTIVCWLTYFSAVSNPLIYAAREQQFKKVLHRIVGSFQGNSSPL